MELLVTWCGVGAIGRRPCFAVDWQITVIDVFDPSIDPQEKRSEQIHTRAEIVVVATICITLLIIK